MVYRCLTIAEIQKRIAKLRGVNPTDLVQHELYALDRELKAQMLDVNTPQKRVSDSIETDFLFGDSEDT